MRFENQHACRCGVPLQRAASGSAAVTCALGNWHASGVARCRRRVPLQDAPFAAVRVVCGQAGATVSLQGVGRMCRALLRCYAKMLS